MKVRESGIPSEKLWEEFFEPEKILRILELNHKVVDVADFGYGYGTFTIPASKAIKGTVYAIDIEEEMTKRVA
jgi:ubiquinone/menaquinone biosynthesis C-methylase UbiE